MIVRSDSIITIYGGFYQGDSRITELEDKVISCVLLNMEGIEIKEFNDITTAEDGSVCVKIQPNTIPSGRYYYHVTLKRKDGTIIATIKNEMEVIMVNDDCCPHNDMCGDEECDSRITPFFAVASDCCPHNDMCGDEECDSRITPFFAVARALQGEDGVGISGIELRDNHLYVTLTNARVIDAGEIDAVSEEDLQDIVAMVNAIEDTAINGKKIGDGNITLYATDIKMKNGLYNQHDLEAVILTMNEKNTAQDRRLTDLEELVEEDQTLLQEVNANTLAIAQLEAATINGMTLVDDEGNAKHVKITLANIEYDGTTGKDSSYPTYGAINAWEAVDMLSNSIKTLNGNAETEGSVDYKIVQAFKWVEVTA